ncbi:OX-2 membrane glycoprotein-like isoform X1 [Sparus aurata]|uniref:OX-2 membrane glycoprotein-like isoform X1 n=1 Tax=Sparus aurata TaxID=8175 RepID=UPI0011C0E521|nr:OX-2 membrane glycoprotein-like isoform X1 [Sparus aurata]
MERRPVVHLLCVLGVFHRGLTDLIRTRRTVTAAVGEEAGFRCELLQSKDVVQVTWHKVLPDREETLASYTTRYGQKVNPAFKDKVGFTDAGLQNSSIFIRNVTEEDEGCYLCLFNADPEGALIGKTCLQVYELHEPVLHVRESGSEETVVSCSATGRPAPTVTLTVLRDNVHFPGNSSVSVNNTNGTVTVTSTAVLTRLHHMDTEVRCAVRVLSAPQKEEVRMIPAEVKQSAEGSSCIIIIITAFSVVAVGCVAVIITVLLIRKPWNSSSRRDPEGRETPKKTNEITENKTPLLQKINELIRRHVSPKVSSSTTGTNQQPSGNETPLMEEMKELIRLQMSTGQKKESNSAKVSSSTRGTKQQLSENKTPLMKDDNEQVRRRVSTAKKKEKDSPKVLTSATGPKRKLEYNNSQRFMDRE